MKLYSAMVVMGGVFAAEIGVATYAVHCDGQTQVADTLEEARKIGAACRSSTYELVEDLETDAQIAVLDSTTYVVLPDISVHMTDVYSANSYTVFLMDYTGGEGTPIDADHCQVTYRGVQIDAQISGNGSGATDSASGVTVVIAFDELPTNGTGQGGIVLECTTGLGITVEGQYAITAYITASTIVDSTVTEAVTTQETTEPDTTQQPATTTTETAKTDTTTTETATTETATTETTTTETTTTETTTPETTTTETTTEAETESATTMHVNTRG